VKKQNIHANFFNKLIKENGNVIEYMYSTGLFDEKQKVEYVLRYLSLRYELDVEKIRAILEKLTIKRSNAMKTFLDYYEEKGIEKGKIEGKIEAAKKILIEGFDVVLLLK